MDAWMHVTNFSASKHCFLVCPRVFTCTFCYLWAHLLLFMCGLDIFSLWTLSIQYVFVLRALLMLDWFSDFQAFSDQFIIAALICITSVYLILWALGSGAFSCGFHYWDVLLIGCLLKQQTIDTTGTDAHRFPPRFLALGDTLIKTTSMHHFFVFIFLSAYVLCFNWYSQDFIINQFIDPYNGKARVSLPCPPSPFAWWP